MVEHMLTTIDNPFSPFTEFDEWYAYDTSAGHHSLSLLARIVNTSFDLSDEDQAQDAEDAMLEIVREDASGVRVRVTKDSKFPLTA